MKWYIKGSDELAAYMNEMFGNAPNVAFHYEDQYFSDPSDDFLEWEWHEEIPEKYYEITLEQLKEIIGGTYVTNTYEIY